MSSSVSIFISSPRTADEQPFGIDLRPEADADTTGHPLAAPFTGEDALRWIGTAPPRIWGRMAFEEVAPAPPAPGEEGPAGDGGPGGQGVNTTYSAVRVVHEPSGVIVTCQNERSQIKNLASAMKVLKARLYELEMERREEELEKIKGPKKDISWGNQIRSYVLQPYRMVKDLRTEHEVGNADRVLDGDIDDFIEAFLHWNAQQEASR